MPITSINRYFVGEPNIVGIVTTDNLVAITTDGYVESQEDAIDSIQHGQFAFTDTDIILIFYEGGIAFFTYDPDTDTFVINNTPGEVILPTVTGNFANWANTTGTLRDDGFNPTNATYTKLVTVNTNNSGASPITANIPVFYDSSGSICQQIAGSTLFAPGPVISTGLMTSRNGGFRSLNTTSNASIQMSVESGIGTSFGSTIQGKGNLTQATTYFMVDPGNASATMATFIGNPVTITSGNLLVAGTVPGTIADGNALASNIVLKSATNTMAASSEIIFDKGTGTVGEGGTIVLNNQAAVITFGPLSIEADTIAVFQWTSSKILASSGILLSVGNAAGGGGDPTDWLACSYLNQTIGQTSVIIKNTNPSISFSGNVLVTIMVI